MKLKPCPFCGNENVKVKIEDPGAQAIPFGGHWRRASVICADDECGVEVVLGFYSQAWEGEKLRSKIEKMWNRGRG